MKTGMYLEHANITVGNLENAITFFQTAFPHFEIRGGGTYNNRKWVHLGDETTYLALNQSLEEVKTIKNYGTGGVNHIGFVVENVDEIAERLLKAGFERDFPKQVEQFRIRDYFADADGNEYEFVQYLSDNIEERNGYDA